MNRGLNRFRDVLPCKTSFAFDIFMNNFYSLDDDTRVRLQRGSNDYINANHVQVPWANRNYILTQVQYSILSIIFF